VKALSGVLAAKLCGTAPPANAAAVLDGLGLGAPPAPPAPPAPQVPQRNTSDLRASICNRPPTTPIELAIAKSQESGTAVISLQYTADGSVTSASVSKSSHNRDLDRAALSWARGVKLCPGAAGSGLLPVVMTLGG